MAAIITDTLRVNNARKLNSLTKLGIPIDRTIHLLGCLIQQVVSNWDTSPPSPRDCLDDSNGYWDTMVALKKIAADDVRPVVKRLNGHLRQSTICIVMMLIK